MMKKKGKAIAILVLVLLLSTIVISAPKVSASTVSKRLVKEIEYQGEKDGNTVYGIIDVYLLVVDGYKYLVIGARDYLTPNTDKGWDIFGDGLWYTWPSGGNSAWILFSDPKSGGTPTSFTAFSPNSHIKKDEQATITWGLSAKAGYASDKGPQVSGSAWVSWTTTIYNEEMWPQIMQQQKGEFIGKLNGAHNYAHVFFGGVTQKITKEGEQSVYCEIGGYFSHNNWITWTKEKLWIYGTIYITIY